MCEVALAYQCFYVIIIISISISIVKAYMPTPKHMRQFTTWQVFCQEEISQPGIESPTSSLKFGYLSTIIQ